MEHPHTKTAGIFALGKMFSHFHRIEIICKICKKDNGCSVSIPNTPDRNLWGRARASVLVTSFPAAYDAHQR